MAGTSKKKIISRGALIVLEGCDKVGKTTQANKLIESLTALGKRVILLKFPDRTTEIGGIINSYLRDSRELRDQVIHLLFSANRWELLAKIISTLQNGISIIVDRYAYSGVAYSAAKKGMNLEWCKQSDVGLPKPDLVLFFYLNPEELRGRAQFGDERYEREKFQQRVYDNYNLLQDETWKVIDANIKMADLHKKLKKEIINIIEGVGERKIGKLWM